MYSRKPVIFPRAGRILTQLGENLRLARLRRQLTAEQVAERADISRTTLWNVEKGSSQVAMATYLSVLFVLGLEKDLLKLAADDDLGRKLQDVQINVKQRGPKRSSAT